MQTGARPSVPAAEKKRLFLEVSVRLSEGSWGLRGRLAGGRGEPLQRTALGSTSLEVRGNLSLCLLN